MVFEFVNMKCAIFLKADIIYTQTSKFAMKINEVKMSFL